MDQLKELQSKIQFLEEENLYLKKLLEQAGISYHQIPKEETYEENQGARILLKTEFSEKDITDFFSMFWGRTDVYSQRAISKTTGKANYYLQCHNFWKYNCPKKSNKKQKCSECKNASFVKLGKEQILKHLKGNKEDGSDVIGIYPMFSDQTCRFIVFDFDAHNNENQDDTWKEEINALRKICQLNGVDALVERSRSGYGAHLWIFFDKKIPASLARRFGHALLRKGSESVNLTSFSYYDRLIPMQDTLPKGGFGNLIALPLQGQALKQGNSAFIDENFNAYPDQWKVLLSKKKLSEQWIIEKIKEWEIVPLKNQISMQDILDKTDEKPWEYTHNFICDDVKGSLNVTLADGIYIKKENLKPRIQNKIRELAAFSNPIFYKNQAMGLSNFNQARYIYLGKDYQDYIRIPRGLYSTLMKKCSSENIQVNVQDERWCGHNIDVSFNGSLDEIQQDAIDALNKTDQGILSAATAFGKTVVSCYLIAQRKVNTLILLQNSSLVEQWENALNRFLSINEELPTYTTPTGRIKKRKNLIGKIQGAHDSSTGIIDIAMVGSLNKKGETHFRLKDYGMVIVDECHHAASDTIIHILENVRAKFVYGATATPIRGDGLQQINNMLLGPICFEYTSKQRSLKQGLKNIVYPRFTRCITPTYNQNNLHPNEAYSILRDSNERDELIINDVKGCIEKNRTPVVLSKYVSQSFKLYQQLQGVADRIFLLSGNNSKKEHKEILNQMNQVKQSESMILIATGSLIGEGFDYPRLDTLVMAMPVAGKSVVEQYAGRLSRNFEGKESVVILDYVDVHIPMFEKMYHKRLRAYKQIGYSIYSEESSIQQQDIHSIYDIDTYFDIYQKDLQSANKEIILSSQTISYQKIEQLIQLLHDQQLNGLKVIIVTWKPEAYRFGDVSYWMHLHDYMRNAGFILNLVDDFCERYCIIDREIVWYGSLNFLGKEDVDDNLMRIYNQSIASELLEMTFGEQKGITYD